MFGFPNVLSQPMATRPGKATEKLQNMLSAAPSQTVKQLSGAGLSAEQSGETSDHRLQASNVLAPGNP